MLLVRNTAVQIARSSSRQLTTRGSQSVQKDGRVYTKGGVKEFASGMAGSAVAMFGFSKLNEATDPLKK